MFNFLAVLIGVCSAIQGLVKVCSHYLLFQPDAPAVSSGTARREEEDDGDLNKALGVQRFQQILSPAAALPDEQLHNYHEEDIECEYAPVLS